MIQAVAAAYASGELPAPRETIDRVHDVAQSGAVFVARRGRRTGRRVVATCDVDPAGRDARSNLGSRDSKIDVVSTHHEGDNAIELIVKVPKWSDGRPVTSVPRL